MGPNDLKSYIDKLASSDDLARVKCQVDPMLEIAAIVNRVCKTAAGGKALLFENVRGSRIHIAANLFGSAQRMSDCFGVDDIEVLSAKIRRDLAATAEGASGEILARLTELPECTAVHAAAAPWQELDVTAQGLEVIPALQSWPGEFVHR